MFSASRAIRTSILALTTTTLLAACGGGGDSGSGGPIGGSPPAPAPVPPAPPAPAPAPPPPENRIPVLSLPIAAQTGIQLHPFDFDVTQGGRTFTDADGDNLAYTVTLENDNIGGLRVEGSRIV